MDIKQLSTQYLDGLTSLFQDFKHDQLERIVACIISAYENEKIIFIMGNGGSGSTASHFACDINKGCCMDLEKKFKVICLNDNIPTILALANDVSYDVVFEEQLKNFFASGDLVIGISGSGNSENVIRAIRYANQNGGQTVGLSGFSGGQLAKAANVNFVVEIDDMQKVEDIHVIIVHMIMQIVYRILHKVTV